MGDNLNDSMADAVENACVILVFVSAAYKEVRLTFAIHLAMLTH